MRRRPWILSSQGVTGLGPLLREESRLAFAAADTVGAVSALRRYLALRTAPEPPFRTEADSLRRLLGTIK